MFRRLGRHVRQNAVAWLALFVALGGTARTPPTRSPAGTSSTTRSHRRRPRRHARLRRPRQPGPRPGRRAQLRGPRQLARRRRHREPRTASRPTATSTDNSLPPPKSASRASDCRRPRRPRSPGRETCAVGDNTTKVVGRTGARRQLRDRGDGERHGVRHLRLGYATRSASCAITAARSSAAPGKRPTGPAAGRDQPTISLSMNGGVQIPAGGGEVGSYCRFQRHYRLTGSATPR